jgi:hypothetical protein
MPKRAGNVSEADMSGILGDMTHNLKHLREPMFFSLNFELDLFTWYIIRFLKIEQFEGTLMLTFSGRKGSHLTIEEYKCFSRI